MGKLLLIIALAIIFFILDALTNKCLAKHLDAIPILLFHHFIYVFALIGWILDDPVVLLLYIVLPPIVALHWRTNANSCFVDTVMGDVCGNETPFRHIGRIMGIPETITTTLIIMGMIIAIYKLQKILRSRQRIGCKKSCIPKLLV